MFYFTDFIHFLNDENYTRIASWKEKTYWTDVLKRANT